MFLHLVGLRNSCLYHAPCNHMLRTESIYNSGDYTSLSLWEFSVTSSVPTKRSIAIHLKQNQVKDKQFRGKECNPWSERDRSRVHCPLPVFWMHSVPWSLSIYFSKFFPSKLSSHTTSSMKLFLIPISHGFLSSILIPLALCYMVVPFGLLL